MRKQIFSTMLALETALARVEGAGGGGKGGGGGGTEQANTLRARNIVRVLEAISEGEIEGPGIGDDWEKSIQLENGTPIKGADDKYNVKGIQIFSRHGLPDQTHIEGFPAIETPFAVDVEVKNGSPGPVTRRITDSDVNAVRLGIGTPAITKQDKDGNIVGHAFDFKIEVKADADNPSSQWVERVRDRFSGKQTGSYQRAYRVDLSGGAPYDIRVTRLSTDETKVSQQNKSTWDYYTEIIDRKLSYPDTALIGMVLNAELFGGSSFPARAFVVKGLKISIPSNYDPVTRVYDGEWDGLFTTAWTNNPAWVLYDLITNDRYGCGEWFAAASVDKWGLYQLAKYCDANDERSGGSTDDYHVTTGKHGVKDGKGGYEPRFTINVSINSREAAYKVLDAVAGMMRSTLLWAGGQISFVQDRPKESTRVFTPANVVNGVFNYAGTALAARHTVVSVTWSNPEKNYDADTLLIEDAEGIQRYGYNQIDLTAFGCTSYGQAYRHALFTLYTERLETDTVQFGVGLADVDILPGEIVKIADPLFTEASHGGRWLTVAAGGGTMDRPFPFDPARTYTLTAVTPSSELITRTLVNPGITTASVAVTVDFPVDLPLIGSMFVLEQDLLTHRRFRVMSITEDNGNASVQALEYIEDKFELIDGNVLTRVEKPDFSDLPDATSILPPGRIELVFSIKLISGVQHGELKATWTPVDDIFLRWYRVMVQQGDGEWVELPPTVNTSVEILDPAIDSVVRVVVFAESHTGLQSEPIAAVMDLGSLANALNQTCIYDLKVAGGGTEWSGRDLFLQWTARSPYAAEPEDDGTGERLTSGADPLLKHFRVDVYAANGVTLLGSFTTLTPEFTVPEERLRAWGAARNYVVKVYFVDRIDADSAPGVLAVSNPTPALPDATITRNADTISVAFVQPNDPDFLGYRVWMSTASPVQTTDEFKVWDGAGAPTLPAETNTTYYLRYAALDVWGVSGAIISDETIVAPAELDNIADFDAYPGEDRVRFVWQQIDANTNIDYEVREGASWATGRAFPRVSGNTLTVQRAVSEIISATYWIKAVTRDGRAESPNARSVVSYQEPTARNQIFEQDESATDWPGVKLNLNLVGSGLGSYLQLAAPGGVRAAYGDYVTDVALGGLFYARNWVETSFGRTTNTNLTWQDIAGGPGGTGTWTLLGDTTWAPQTEPVDGATLVVKIATAETAADLIEGWRLSANTTGARGTVGDMDANISSAPCYNDNGQLMGLDSHIGWDLTALAAPAMDNEFSFAVVVQPVDATPVLVPTSMRICEFTNGSNYLAIEWSSVTGNFTLIDGTNTVTLAAPTWVADSPIVVGIVQTATTRYLMYYDINNAVGGSASGAHALAWVPARLDLGGDYAGAATWDDLASVTWTSLAGTPWEELVDVTKETEAVFGNAEIRSTLYSPAEWEAFAQTRGPAGYTTYRTFLDGDYSYQNAVVWARLAATPDATGDITLNELWTFADLPDLLDRGSATIAVAGTGVAVTFARTFHATPEISITQVGSGAVAIPQITARSSTGFTVKLYDVNGTAVTGDVSWRAEGY